MRGEMYMFGLPVIIMIFAILVIFYSKDWNFGEFGMPKNYGGIESIAIYLEQYKYIKNKGHTATIMSLALGSFGMIPLSLILAFVFFFLNAIMYMVTFMFAIKTLGESNWLLGIVIVRIINALIVYIYVQIRLFFIETNINRLIKTKYNSDNEKDVYIRENTRTKLLSLKQQSK